MHRDSLLEVDRKTETFEGGKLREREPERERELEREKDWKERARERGGGNGLYLMAFTTAASRAK